MHWLDGHVTHGIDIHIEDLKAMFVYAPDTRIRVRPVRVAQVYAWRGENDQAFEWLERAYKQQDGGLPSIKGDPLLKSLHADPRFNALLRKVKLPE